MHVFSIETTIKNILTGFTKKPVCKTLIFEYVIPCLHKGAEQQTLTHMPQCSKLRRTISVKFHEKNFVKMISRKNTCIWLFFLYLLFQTIFIILELCTQHTCKIALVFGPSINSPPLLWKHVEWFEWCQAQF